MASIKLEHVYADFPIYGSQVSFRKVLFNKAIGGLLSRADDGSKRVTVRALSDVTLEVNHGDQLGIIGHNGAGKSTLLRLLAGIYEPSLGRITIEGGVSPLFNTSPGLDLDDTGYENIVTCGLFLGMSREEIAAKTPDIEQFAELGEYMSLPVRTYSTGMLVRLGFAIATAIDPEILLLDEGLGAGDARFANRVRKRIEALIGRSSIMILASHSDSMIEQMCNRAILLNHGKVVADGKPKDVIARYAEMNREVEAAPPPPPAEDASVKDLEQLVGTAAKG
jgi:ABC-type polysaccharide/polyol phosphate transport system ATPase subunit